MTDKFLARFGGSTEGRRNIMVLMSGSVFAQVIPIAIMPVLTRLFGPDELGTLAVFTSICAILGVVATGRYEQAILIPPDEGEARYVTSLAVGLSCIVSLVLGVAFLGFGQQIAAAFGHPDYVQWLVYLPVALFFVSAQQVVSLFFTRQKRFKAVALSMVVFQVVYQGGSVGAGYFHLGAKGLIGSYVLGSVAALVWFLRGLDPNDRAFLREMRFQGISASAKRFKRFPQVLVFSHLLNAASLNMTSILFSSFFGLAPAGFYALAQRAARTPLSLIGQPYGQVFRQQAGEMLNRTGECRTFFLRTLGKMAAMCVVPFAVLFAIAPTVFSLVFGEQWREAGTYVRVMTPMFFLQFVTSPICYIVVLRERQLMDFGWQAGLLASTLGSLYLGHELKLSVEGTLGLFSSAYCVMYVIQIYLNWLVAGPRAVVKGATL